MGGLSGSRFGEEQQQTVGVYRASSGPVGGQTTTECSRLCCCLLVALRAQRWERCGGGGTAVHRTIQLCVLEEEI